MLDRFRLDGKTALITGGARGLGQTMATALAQVGADIALCRPFACAVRGGRGVDRRRDRPTRQGLRGRRDRARPTSIGSSTTVEAELGPIDVLINSAGINMRGTSHELAEADWDIVIDTNLKGTFLCCRGLSARGW